MPIEGLPTADTQTTPDAAVNNTDAPQATTPPANANSSGAATDTAQPNQDDKKFTQADLDRYLSERVQRGIKAKLKELSGEGEGMPTVTDLQRQLSESQTRIRAFEAREVVENFLNDGRNKLNVSPANVRGIQALVTPLLEYDEAGKPTNLKEAIDVAKSIAPALFTSNTSNINANNGNGHTVTTTNMNDLIRRSAGVIG